jgi:hypothetical protein
VRDDGVHVDAARGKISFLRGRHGDRGSRREKPIVLRVERKFRTFLERRESAQIESIGIEREIENLRCGWSRRECGAEAARQDFDAACARVDRRDLERPTRADAGEDPFPVAAPFRCADDSGIAGRNGSRRAGRTIMNAERPSAVTMLDECDAPAVR